MESIKEGYGHQMRSYNTVKGIVGKYLVNRVFSDNHIGYFSLYWQSQNEDTTHTTNIFYDGKNWGCIETLRNDLMGINLFDTKNQAIWFVYKTLKKTCGKPEKFLIGQDIPNYMDSEDTFYNKITNWESAL
jgi:hypothetical protein